MIKFIILSSQRSGSTFFRKYIGSHTQVECHGEIFIDKRFDAYMHDNRYYAYCDKKIYRKALYSFNLNKFLALSYLNHFYSTSYPGVRAKGFKMMYNQYRKNFFTKDIFKNKDIRVIHLIRNNLLNKLISKKVLKIRKISHTKKKMAITKVYLNTNTLIKKLRKLNSEIDQFRKKLYGINHIEVFYENFADSPKTQSEKVLQFLSIEKEETLSCSLIKINPNDIRKKVDNYNEVNELLLGTEFSYLISKKKRFKNN